MNSTTRCILTPECKIKFYYLATIYARRYIILLLSLRIYIIPRGNIIIITTIEYRYDCKERRL